jgi:hypothetical protein
MVWDLDCFVDEVVRNCEKTAKHSMEGLLVLPFKSKREWDIERRRPAAAI